jgi:signal transduction histidine kinase
MAFFAVLGAYILLGASSLLASPRIDSLKTVLPTAIDTERVAALNELAREYRYISLDTSYMFAKQALTLSEKLGNKNGIANALRSIGMVYENQGKYDFALDYLLRAVTLFEETGDKTGLASSLNLIGEVYRGQEKYDDALAYYRRSMAIHKAMGNQERVATLLTNICSCYLQQKRFANVVDTLLYAEQLYKQASSPTIFSAWYVLSEYYLTQGDATNALKYAQLARASTEKSSNKRYYIAALHNISMSYDFQGRKDSTIAYALQARDAALEYGFRDELKKSYHILAEIYAEEKKFDSALTYFRKYSTLKDSLFSAEMQNNMMHSQMELATATQQQEIKRLSLFRNSLILGVVLLCLLALVIANRYRLKKKAADELRRTNDEILRQQNILEKQATEIELSNTELHTTNESLYQRNFELAEINREKNEILGIVAHDLKNPVSNIRMLSKLLRNDATNLSVAEVQEFSGDIYTVAERMFELITTLLDVNAIEEGTIRFNFSVFEIASITENVVLNYRSRAQAKDITLHFEQNQSKEGTERYPVVAYADKNATLQVLDNLFSNAIKYSPYNRNVWIRVLSDDYAVLHDTTPQGGLLAPSQDFIRIEIQDEGPGLTNEDKEKIFGKFTRLSAKPTAGEHSTGLGLSIVKKMVEGMNGKVWVESEFGKGATFILLLPKGEALI